MTLATVPDAVKTQRPVLLRRQKREMASTTSVPPGTSKMKELMVGSGSRVMMTGGFGLFFEPGGRPRGRLTTSMLEPSAAAAPEGLGRWLGVVVVVSSSSEV